jgi:hypothetical protein
MAWGCEFLPAFRSLLDVYEQPSIHSRLTLLTRTKIRRVGDMEFRSKVRRSSRIAKQIPVILRWQPPGGDVEDDPANTVLLSKHGCSLTCRVQLNSGGLIYVLDPARGKSARARIVYRESIGTKEEVRLAVEFQGTDNFWDIEFALQPQRLAPRP